MLKYFVDIILYLSGGGGCLVLSCVQLFATLWAVARQAPLSRGFPRQEYRSGLPLPTPGDLLGMAVASPVSPALQADSLPAEPSGYINLIDILA